MNCVSIIPDLSLHGLQLQNIKRNTVKITKKYNINHSIESTEKKVLPTSGDEIPNKIERNIPAIPNIDTTSQNITANIPTIPESSIALSSTNISDLSTVINI